MVFCKDCKHIIIESKKHSRGGYVPVIAGCWIPSIDSEKVDYVTGEIVKVFVPGSGTIRNKNGECLHFDKKYTLYDLLEDFVHIGIVGLIVIVAIWSILAIVSGKVGV